MNFIIHQTIFIPGRHLSDLLWQTDILLRLVYLEQQFLPPGAHIFELVLFGRVELLPGHGVEQILVFVFHVKVD